MALQSLWNPFRDWNFLSVKISFQGICFKASETLLGIETWYWEKFLAHRLLLQSLWNPFRDWNISQPTLIRFPDIRQNRFKASETLLGIETGAIFDGDRSKYGCFKASETLLGIETCLIIGLEPIPKALQSLWNPFRDWNSGETTKGYWYASSFKASETLLGIETWIFGWWGQIINRFKASETLLGIETQWACVQDAIGLGFKASETLLGIETCNYYIYGFTKLCFKASETLLGIETVRKWRRLNPPKASKPLKPF